MTEAANQCQTVYAAKLLITFHRGYGSDRSRAQALAMMFSRCLLNKGCNYPMVRYWHGFL